MPNQYTICFDFPEMSGDPLFATWLNGTLALGPKLELAAKFHDEESAEKARTSCYIRQISECGTVVEVGS